jgi:hypothetical protein
MNLADEALDGVERGRAVAIGRFGGLADLARRQQAGIDVGRDQAVKDEGAAGLHRVLVLAEDRQGRRYERLERL